MRTLGIVGSARKGGNTDRLVEEILRGAAEAGSRTEKIYLADFDIRPCRGCPCCPQKPKKPCVVQDDLPMIGQLMEAAQLIVVSTPVYWYGPSGLFKVFLDRWISFSQRVFEDTHVAAAITMQDASPETARPTQEMLQRSFSGSWISYEGSILAPGIHYVAGSIDEHPDLLRNGFEFGQSMVARIQPELQLRQGKESSDD